MIAALLTDAGWEVQQHLEATVGDEPLLVAHQNDTSYLVHVTTAAEGRSDRLVPLWSQAYLQALRAAGEVHQPLAIVAAPKISPRAAEQVLSFAGEYVPHAAAAVVDATGLRRFRGEGLEGLDADPDRRPAIAPAIAHAAGDLFSDLNQWMLKVLLAPELPAALLSAPRARFRHASELARAADVSVMSAHRLVQQLGRDGFLHESSPHLALVRREELFRRWGAAAERRTREVPMRFLLPGDPRERLRKAMDERDACLALFAAADALRLGFVEGVPPYVYVPRLREADVAAWRGAVPAGPGDVPDFILRQAPAPRSVFRGAVRVGGTRVCDVVQVWLDVATHPARGAEQAELIRRRVLAPLLGEAGDG